MINIDLHTHTTFCDGENTPEEMVLAAIEKGMPVIGFSGHSYTFYDESYCMTREKNAQYRSEIARLKDAYAGRIRILCGIEQDYYSDMPTEGYDYVIGSVHYLKFGDAYIPMDEGNDVLEGGAERFCGGDMLGLLEEYYRTVADVVEKTRCDIIGHFDLPVKYFGPEQEAWTRSGRYRAAWKKAADCLLRSGVPFEINTGAMLRSGRMEQYPSDEILEYLGERGAKVVLSGDAHSCAGLCHAFPGMEEKCRRYGLTPVIPEFARF